MTLAAYTSPPDIATDKGAWEKWRLTRQAQFEANCPSARATTYYFSTSGNNSNDGLSAASPKQTRAAAITLSSGGNVRLRFKRGDVWRETGNWALPSNCTVDDYGDPSAAKPVFDRFTVRHLDANNDWGSQSGNRWQVAETTDVAWIKLSAYPFRALQRVQTAADCANTSESWAWVSNVLYINLSGDNPNNFDVDVCPSNDGENGVECVGDGCRVENIVAYGWGCHRTTSATQDQPLTNRSTGGNVYRLGLTNSSNVKNNVLYGLTDSTGVERGYNLTTNPIVTATAPVMGTYHASAVAAGSTELMLSHDINGKPRTAGTPDIGPIDFSSALASQTILINE